MPQPIKTPSYDTSTLALALEDLYKVVRVYAPSNQALAPPTALVCQALASEIARRPTMMLGKRHELEVYLETLFMRENVYVNGLDLVDLFLVRLETYSHFLNKFGGFNG